MQTVFQGGTVQGWPRLEENSDATCQLYDAVPKGLPTDVMWINRWMTAGKPVEKKKRCQLDQLSAAVRARFSWKLRSFLVWPLPVSARDLSWWAVCCEFASKRHPLLLRRQARQQALLCTNCKGFQHESSLTSSPRFSCHCAPWV